MWGKMSNNLFHSNHGHGLDFLQDQKNSILKCITFN